MVIWIIGLSGAGKTTVAAKVAGMLKEKNLNAIHIDGDDMRFVWGDDLTHKMEDREKNSRRIQRLCTVLEKQGAVVVVSMLSIFQHHRDENRIIFSKYFELFLDYELDELKKRDNKNLYSRALEGSLTNVVGVDMPFQKPTGSDLVIDDPALSADSIARIVTDRWMEI